MFVVSLDVSFHFQITFQLLTLDSPTLCLPYCVLFFVWVPAPFILLLFIDASAASVSPSPIWVHCSVVPPGRRKDVPPIPLPLATISMKQLCDYAQQQFEFPEANFTITPAVDRTRREEEENVTSKLLLIQSDEQLRHHLSTLHPNEHHVIHFRFVVRLEQKQFSDWRWNQISKSFKLSENLISHIDTEVNKLVIQPMNTNNER